MTGRNRLKGRSAATVVAGSALVGAALVAGVARVGSPPDEGARSPSQHQPQYTAVDEWVEPPASVSPQVFQEEANPVVPPGPSAAPSYAAAPAPSYAPAPAPTFAPTFAPTYSAAPAPADEESAAPGYAAPAPEPRSLSVAPEPTPVMAPPAVDEPRGGGARRMASAPPAAAPMMQPAASDPAAMELPAGARREAGQAYSTVSVFYATDRAASDAPLSAYRLSGARQAVTLLGGAACCLALFSLFAYLLRHRSVGALSAVGACAAAGLAGLCVLLGQANIEKHGVDYTSERGELVHGICNVTVPDSHAMGEVERPSLLRLEIREDQDKHIVLTSAVEMSQDEFRRRLSATVDEAPERDLLVFIHGFNVDFVSAVRRTAQIAVDLPFRGVPVCYSWPSQASLLGYTVDENNAAWTVSHLKSFLLDLAATSGADSINLVAHSMGNRSLTSALSEISMEMGDAPAMFDRVVLAAPDVDADHFRRDLAPRLLQTADSVTLYASSDDRALIASKQVHGYPRAGESGEALVVVPGIETIDVSGIDLSLLGHSYYGDSGQILRDLFDLVHHRLPASQRQWLRPQPWGQLVYYRLLTDPPLTARREITDN